MPEIEEVSIDRMIEIAKQAGVETMTIYNRNFSVDEKEDHTPVTEADEKANDQITKALKRHYPDIPIISEETKEVAYEERKHWDRFWLVDPLDGTKEFIKKNGEFTINIALVENGKPVMGVVYLPAKQEMYYGVAGEGAYKAKAGGEGELLQPGSHYSAKEQVKVVASRSHLTQEVDDFVKELEKKGKSVDFTSAGSSLKFCLVAEGSADVYPRFGPTMEWDTGAAQAIAEAAGKQVLDATNREPLTYNKEDLHNPWFIVE